VNGGFPSWRKPFSTGKMSESQIGQQVNERSDFQGATRMYAELATDDVQWAEMLRQARVAQAQLKEYFRNQEELRKHDGDHGGRMAYGLTLATVLTLLLAFAAVVVA
jgi:hypothetical protein